MDPGSVITLRLLNRVVKKLAVGRIDELSDALLGDVLSGLLRLCETISDELDARQGL